MVNQEEKQNNQIIPKTASQFEHLIRGILGKSFDIIIERFMTPKDEGVIVYVEGMVDKDLVDRDILYPMKTNNFDGNVELAIKAVYDTEKDMTVVIKKILEGNLILFYDNMEKVFIIEFKSWDRRSVTTPESESVTRGPKEGFTENIQTNTSLIRRKLKTPNLTIEKMVLGRQTNTLIVLVYLEDIVNKLVLSELKRRLNTIDTDSILESGDIEQLIEKNPLSIKSGMGLTQKPDILASRILEGRVGVMCEGTPHVLTVPELFIENFHTSEDYYSRTFYANFMRTLRVMAFLICILLPGVSIAIVTFSQEMLPFELLSSFIASSEATPLPEAAEVFFLIIMFELLKEAGLRLPKTIGSAITIVGALIIGDSAVNAGIVGAPTVIIVALTAVSSLLVPNLNEFTTMYRLLFLFLGATMGLIGIGTGIMILLINLISTESFGIPILSSFSKEELKDDLLRLPLRKLQYRPNAIAKNNIKRKNMDAEGDE